MKRHSRNSSRRWRESFIQKPTPIFPGQKDDGNRFIARITELIREIGPKQRLPDINWRQLKQQSASVALKSPAVWAWPEAGKIIPHRPRPLPPSYLSFYCFLPSLFLSTRSVLLHRALKDSRDSARGLKSVGRGKVLGWSALHCFNSKFLIYLLKYFNIIKNKRNIITNFYFLHKLILFEYTTSRLYTLKKNY